MTDSKRRLGFIDIYKKGVAHWQAEGNRVREKSSREAMLLNVIAVALHRYGSAGEAAGWLQDQDVERYLAQHLALFESLVGDMRSGQVPASSLGGGYVQLALSAFAWSLGEADVGARYVALLSNDETLALMSPFWREYHRAVEALIARSAFKPAAIEPRGLETHWKAYIDLVACLAGERDASEALVAVDRAFAKRNTDKRLNSDAYEIEGSASNPARWDFRREGLLAYAGASSA